MDSVSRHCPDSDLPGGRRRGCGTAAATHPSTAATPRAAPVPPGRPGPALVPRIASPRAGGAPWSPGPALSRYGCGDRQLPDPAEATGEGVQQRPGVGLQAPLQPQQRRALPVREARSRGIQQSALLQRPQEAGEAETRSVAARRVGFWPSSCLSPSSPPSKHLRAAPPGNLEPPLPSIWVPFHLHFQASCFDFALPVKSSGSIFRKHFLDLCEATVGLG